MTGPSRFCQSAVKSNSQTPPTPQNKFLCGGVLRFLLGGSFPHPGRSAVTTRETGNSYTTQGEVGSRRTAFISARRVFVCARRARARHNGRLITKCRIPQNLGSLQRLAVGLRLACATGSPAGDKPVDIAGKVSNHRGFGSHWSADQTPERKCLE